MLCTYCGTHNPENNRFCGECGQPLVVQQVTVPPEERHQTTISGPSFLGLTDTSEADETDYLLEDDRPRRSHLGWFIFSTVAVAILAVIGWMEWQAIKTGRLPVPGSSTSSASESTPPATTSTTSTNAPTPSDSASASPADQKPQTDGSEASTSGDPTNSSSASAPPTADANTDQQATQESQSRIAKESEQRRADAEASDDSDQSTTAEEKPTPRSKPVSATASKPPDPRQNPMLISGEKYLYGRGVRQDCNQALIYFKGAAEGNNAPAMSHLGAMYASGHCVTPNKVMAYKWFSRASEAEPANQWFSRSMNMLWRDMSPQERASVAR